MTGVGVAIVMMMSATLAVHMGLSGAIGKVVAKVLGCHKCLSFWLVLVVMVHVYPIWLALLLSLVCSWLSGWFGMVLVVLNRIYERLWEKLRK